MKRNIALVVIAFVVCLIMGACSKNNGDSNTNSEFVGEWKANQVSSVMDGETAYKTVVVQLNKDGTGSYKDKQGTWEVKDNTTIVLTLTNENIGMVFEIDDEEGKTVLKYYQDVFYRASEFVEKQ